MAPHHLKSLLTITTVVLGLATLIESQANQQIGCPCDLTIADMQARGSIDRCTKVGTFKSKTKCFHDPTSLRQYRPYEFYTCAPYGNSFLLYPRDCNLNWIFVNDQTPGTQVPITTFNPYNEATGRCNLTPPVDAYVTPIVDPLMGNGPDCEIG